MQTSFFFFGGGGGDGGYKTRYHCGDMANSDTTQFRLIPQTKPTIKHKVTLLSLLDEKVVRFR